MWLFPHQRDAVKNLLYGGLLWAVCGSGKTNVIKRIAQIHSEVGYRVIIVVPWLALMDMFYVKSGDLAALGDPFEVSSRPQGTTNKKAIRKNIRNENGPRLILCTYKTLRRVRAAIERIGGASQYVIYFDEAHHIHDEKALEHATWLWDHAKRAWGFSATPGEKLINFVKTRGAPIHQYTLSDAFEQKVCNPWDLKICMVDQDNSQMELAEAIVIAYEKTGNGKVLCKHRFSTKGTGKRGTTANTYLTAADLENAWAKHFPTKEMPQITVKPITEYVPKKRRDQFIEDQSKAAGLFVIPFCEYLSEGVDTKYVNMVVVVDNMQSPKKIVQTIGRVQRCQTMGKHDMRDDKPAPGTVLLVTTLDRDACVNVETRTEEIREKVAEPFARVVAALKTIGLDLEQTLALMEHSTPAQRCNVTNKSNKLAEDDDSENELEDADKFEDADNGDEKDEKEKPRRNAICKVEYLLLFELDNGENAIDFTSGCIQLVNLQVTAGNTLLTVVEKARELAADNVVPKTGDKNATFTDGTLKGKWWNNAKDKKKGCIATNAEVREIIKNCKVLWDDYQQTLDKRSVTPLTVTEKARELAADKVVPTQGDKDATFTDGALKGTWWMAAKDEKKGYIANNAEVREIIKNCTVLWDNYQKTVDNRTTAPLTVVEKARELAADNVVPKKGDKNATFFTDGVLKGKWWMAAKDEKKGYIANNAEVREIIKNCKVLWDDYQKSVDKRTTAPLTVAEKARELAADKVVPTRSDKDATFTDGVPKGTWWNKAKDEKKGCIANNAEVREIIKNCKVLWDNYQQTVDNREEKAPGKKEVDGALNDTASATTADLTDTASDVNGSDEDNDSASSSSDSKQMRLVQVKERSEYDDERLGPVHAQWKNDMSHRFANYAKEFGPIGPIVYFDGNKLRTTTILLGHGISPQLLYVANPKTAICNALRAKGVHTFCGTFEDSNWTDDFFAAYLDTTYANENWIIACIDKVLHTSNKCKIIGFTMLPRSAGSVDSRLGMLTEYLARRGYEAPQDDLRNYQSDHANVYTRFYVLKKMKRTATSPPEVDTPRLEKVLRR